MIDNRLHVIGKYKCFDFETITVADTAIGITASILAVTPKPKMAIFTAETAQMRYRMDGTDPTATVGHILNANASLVLEGTLQLNNTKFIRTGSSGKLQVSILR